MRSQTRTWRMRFAPVALAFVFALPALARPADPESTDAVERAIARGVKALKDLRGADRLWEPTPPPPAGGDVGLRSSMALHALVVAGEGLERFRDSVSALDHLEFTGAAALAAKMQVWQHRQRPSRAEKTLLKQNAEMLMNGVKGPGAERQGLFQRSLLPTDGVIDLAASADATHGMWAAAQCNLEVPTNFWKLVDQAWRKEQLRTGGWATANGTFTMAAAGAASLLTVAEMLNNLDGACRGNPVDREVNAAVAWLSAKPEQLFNEPDPILALYESQRVSRALGLRYFGKTDLRAAGVAHLLKTQREDGTWGPAADPVPSTARAMIYLSNDRGPVMMNKLRYAIDGAKEEAHWNQRPRDVANLVAWTARHVECLSDPSWQVVDLATPEEVLHESPVMYIAGNQALNFNAAELAALKRYVERGGMILGHADCDNQMFTASFLRLGTLLFPQYNFRDLPPDHPVFIYRHRVPPKTLRLVGLSNGARELMILIPSGDPGQLWQINSFFGTRTKPAAELVVNVFLFSCEGSWPETFRRRGQSHLVAPDPAVKATRTIRVARLAHDANWDPEPAGWNRLAAVLHNARATDVTTTEVKIGDGRLNANVFAVAHLTGTGKFALNAAQRAELAAYVKAGGTLVVDAAGGDAPFAAAARAELTAAFGNAPAVLPADHPFYTAGPEPLAKLRYTAFARWKDFNLGKRPHLEAIAVNGRPTAVVFSPEDLSVGLVGMRVSGIVGYDPETATELMTRVLLNDAK